MATVCFLAVTFLLFAGVAARADWNPGEPYKWLQLPDLATAPSTGVDVDCTDHPADGPHRVVADDFLCTSTDPITDIHIWGSWRNDYLPNGVDPNAVTFRLTLMTDVPALGTTYSHPGQILWERYFNPGSYTSRVYAGGLGQLDEYFYDPVSGQVNWPGDRTVWQYNFKNIVDPYLQRGTPEKPLVYWLGVDAVVQDPQAEFGWKTSLQHWNDDGTWQIDEMNPQWNELVYFPENYYHGQSMDLAFVITPEPSTVIMLCGAGLLAALAFLRRRLMK
jgi:hypothetical protein